jgi:hypothetical protein
VRRIDQFFIMLAVFVFYSAQCWADTWQQTVSARISTEYESNPTMSPTNPGDVKRVIFEPNYSLIGRIDENEFTTGLSLQTTRSSNETLSPNRNSPSGFFNWLRQSELGEFGISTRYAEIATRDATVDITGIAPAASTRTSRTLSGRWSNALSERSTLLMDGIYENVSYTGGTFVDFATRTGSMIFNYVWSEYSTPFFQISHTDYDPLNTNLPSSFTNTAVAGLNWKSSETLEGSLTMGKSMVNNTEISTQGTLAIRYTGQRTHLNFSIARQVAPSGLGSFVTTDQANGSWSYALSAQSNTGIDLGWQQSHLPAADITNRTAGAWLQHELNSFWGVRTYYQIRNILNGGVVGDASSYILGLTLVYTHTDF